VHFQVPKVSPISSQLLTGGGLVPWPVVFAALREVNGPVRLLF
jgi:hypothetical protein